MDRNAFDGLARLLAETPSRRKALGVLLGVGLTGALTVADAAGKNRQRRRGGKRGKAQVAAEAACGAPGPSSNISGCNFQNADFSGDDLSGSRMVGTNFRGASLDGADMSSSNARNAIFREADLSCADLRSSVLNGADFRSANLTGANLKSSGGCNSATFNPATTFCGTIMCDGTVRNDDCAGGLPPGTCGGPTCVPAECEAGNNACRQCSCGGDFCLCLFVGCTNGPCDPVTGCPQCDPVACAAGNNACRQCSCGAGTCLCGITACENGPCDPVTGCPPPLD